MNKKDAAVLFAQAQFTLAEYGVFESKGKKQKGFDFIIYDKEDNSIKRILVKATVKARTYNIVSLVTSIYEDKKQKPALYNPNDYDELVAVILESNLIYRIPVSDVPRVTSLNLTDKYLQYIWHPLIKEYADSVRDLYERNPSKRVSLIEEKAKRKHLEIKTETKEHVERTKESQRSDLEVLDLFNKDKEN